MCAVSILPQDTPLGKYLFLINLRMSVFRENGANTEKKRGSGIFRRSLFLLHMGYIHILYASGNPYIVPTKKSYTIYAVFLSFFSAKNHMHQIRHKNHRDCQICENTVCLLNQCQQSELSNTEIHKTADKSRQKLCFRNSALSRV